MLKGKIEKAVHLKGIRVSRGAKEAILAAGGTVEAPVEDSETEQA
jgi:ribosomal protein L15